MCEPTRLQSPAPLSASDEPMCLQTAFKIQDKWIKEGFEEVLDTAQQVYESGEAQAVPKTKSLKKRNKSKVYAPDEVDYALRAIGVSVEDHGFDATGPETMALVPLGPAFVDADAAGVVRISAPVTEEVTDLIERLAASDNGEELVGGIVEELTYHREVYAPVLEQLGWLTPDGSRTRFEGENQTLRNVSPHLIAGLPSRGRMRVERDAVVTAKTLDGRPVARVLEYKSYDPRLFSTQQLGRGLHATLAEERGQRVLAAGGVVETWAVHRATRSADDARTLRLYKVTYDGPDTVFDRRITETYELHFDGAAV